MDVRQRKAIIFSVLLPILFLFSTPSFAGLIKGIYITQSTAENTQYLTYLINRAKKVGIDTFIIDVSRQSKKYQENMQLVKASGIYYVARVVVFADGGEPQQVKSQEYWQHRYRLVQYALACGANEIQLDYIRYNTKQPASANNAKDILQVIQWFKARVNVPLQIDVFGIASFGEEKHIGQNIPLFAQSVNAICPMVYPSHYEPYQVHAVTPYDTVHKSLVSIHKQFGNQALPFKLYPYIELSNYRYPLSQQKKLDYIYAQIKAAENANADGWYVWSAHNKYDNLFYVMETRDVK